MREDTSASKHERLSDVTYFCSPIPLTQHRAADIQYKDVPGAVTREERSGILPICHQLTSHLEDLIPLLIGEGPHGRLECAPWSARRYRSVVEASAFGIRSLVVGRAWD